MNFKRYHVSKNLFNYSTITTGYRIQWTTGNDYVDDTAVMSDYISVTTGSYSTNVGYLIVGYDNSKAYVGVYRTEGTWEKRSSAQVSTFTVAADSGVSYIRLLTYATYDPITSTTMLNTGSTALPYEPYGDTWTDSHYIRGTATDTLTLPQTIYGDGTNATVTLKGNMQQTGTPTTTTPIQPQGTGERTAQLISSVAFPSNYLRFWVENIKSIVATEDTFTFSFTSDVSMAGNSLYLSYTGGSRIVATVGGGTGNLKTTFTLTSADIANILSSSDTYFQVYKSGADFSNCTNIMLNTGETTLPYEPYGVKIPISNNSTTYNKYLGEEQTVRQIKELVLDGTESWNEGTSNYYIFLNVSGRGEGVPYSAALSTHTESGVEVNNNGTALFFKKSVFVHSSLADFKTYLQQQYANSTPVTAWYILANETTGIVNEPLRKIGDYADTLSTSIPTTDGANVIDVGTTLKPSEVSAAYHGWHPVASVHEKSRNLFDVNRTQSNVFTLDETKWFIGAASTSTVSSNATAAIVDGKIEVSTTVAGYGCMLMIPAKPQTQYYISFNVDKTPSGTYFAYSFRNTSGEVLYQTGSYEPYATVTTYANTAYLNICLRLSPNDGTATYSNIMVVEGSTPQPYEPYWN